MLTMLRRRRRAATLAAPRETAGPSGRGTAPPRDSTHGCARAFVPRHDVSFQVLTLQSDGVYGKYFWLLKHSHTHQRYS